MSIFKFAREFTLLFLAIMIAGCGGGSSASTGTLSISLMDRPVDGVTELYVTISEVWIKPQGSGPAVQVPMTSTPLTVNLLALNDGNASVLVDEAVISADSYNWIELKIEDANISESYAMTTVGGMVPVDVDVPSGKIRLVSGFDVGPNQALRFLFDWDVRKGLTEAVGRNLYLLRPAFRILDVDEYGSLSGTISADTIMLDATCQGVADPTMGKVVYIFEGDVTPDDIDGINPDPLTTVDAVPRVVTSEAANSDYDYRTILMPGNYTVAFTCLGDTDDDEESEELDFLLPTAGNPVTVTGATPADDIDF
jgi:hypothetical protein